MAVITGVVEGWSCNDYSESFLSLFPFHCSEAISSPLGQQLMSAL